MVIFQAEDNFDPSLFEFAWAGLLENSISITVETLAELIYGIAEPLESYCVHILLPKDEVYFSVLERQGFHSVYAPRFTDQRCYLVRSAACKMERCVCLLKNFLLESTFFQHCGTF